MGLADFFATAGEHTGIGQIAQALGGKTDRQRELDDFINNQLPTIADSINKASTRNDVVKGMQALIGSGLKVGIPADKLGKISEMLVQPALQGLQQNERDSLLRDYGPKAAEPRPPGVEGPLTEKGNFIDPQQARNPLAEPEGALRVIKAFGVNKPEDVRHILEAPGEIQAKQLGNKKAELGLNQEQARETAIQGLSTEPMQPGLPSTQAVARINPAGLSQFLPARERPDDPLLEERRGLLTAETNAANARADRLSQPPTSPGEKELTPYQKLQEEARLRDKFEADSKGFKQVRDSYNRIKTSGQNPSPAGDLSMLYNYMKMLDPGSVVRESEFRAAQTAKPLLERLGLSWNSVSSAWSGKKLTDNQRRDFLNRANQLYQSEAQQHAQRVKEVSRVAQSSGVDPSRVVMDQGAAGDTGVIKLRRNPQTGKLEPAQ